MVVSCHACRRLPFRWIPQWTPTEVCWDLGGGWFGANRVMGMRLIDQDGRGQSARVSEVDTPVVMGGESNNDEEMERSRRRRGGGRGEGGRGEKGGVREE